MSRSKRSLPEYDRPPVSEVVAVVEFAPLRDWVAPHAGLYWSQIRERYPKTEVHPVVISAPDFHPIDVFAQMPPRVEIFRPGVMRTWFLSADQQHIIQVQNDRFIFNWRKYTGNETYPRFDDFFLPSFQKELDIFRNFISTSGIGSIEINNCELAYVNDLVQGTDWKTLEDAFSFFKYFGEHISMEYLPALETFNMSGMYNIDPQDGRLRYQLAHVHRPRDNAKLVQFSLNARGVAISGADDLFNWLRTAREWIVNGFTDLTTPKAHEIWGRTQ